MLRILCDIRHNVADTASTGWFDFLVTTPYCSSTLGRLLHIDETLEVIVPKRCKAVEIGTFVFEDFARSLKCPKESLCALARRAGDKTRNLWKDNISGEIFGHMSERAVLGRVYLKHDRYVCSGGVQRYDDRILTLHQDGQAMRYCPILNFSL